MTDHPTNRGATAMVIFAAFVLLVLAMIPLSPAYPSNPNRDAGVFLYAGQSIVDGGVPYRDFWDHKPPLIFFINAVGLVLLPSWWGVWAIELAAAAASVLLTWRLVAKRWGAVSALMANGVWICGLHLFSIGGRGGNLTEEYALPLQFAALVIWSTRRKERGPAAWIAFGALASLAMLLKPPLIGVWIAMVIVDTLTQPRTLPRSAFFAALGFAMPLAVFGAYFAATNALPDALDQVLHYNAIYSGGGSWPNRIDAALFGLRLLWTSGAALALVYAPIGAIRGWTARRSDALLLACVIDLPIELTLAAIPGRTYEHYFLAILPAAAIIAGAAIGHFLQRMPRWSARTPVLLTVLAILILLASPLSMIRDALVHPRLYRHALIRDGASKFVRDVTDPDDTVLVWGAEASVNFLAERKSPTRYVYLHPLMTTGYADAGRVDEFLNDLRRNRPALILDSSPTEPLFMPLSPAERARWTPWPVYTPPPSMLRAASWIEGNYVLVGTLPSGWRVFVPGGASAIDPRVTHDKRLSKAEPQ